jgi:hypothetical protein
MALQGTLPEAGAQVDRRPWWLAPWWLTLAATMPGLVVVLLLKPDTMMFLWGQPTFVTQDLALTYLVAVAALITGQIVGNAFQQRSESVLRTVDVAKLSRVSRALFFVAIGAYLVWAISGVAHGLSPRVVVDALQFKANAAFSSKAALVTIPGITTATEFGRACFPIDVWLWRRQGRTDARRRALVLFALASLRAVLNTERLSLLELVVPATLVLLSTGRGRVRAMRWRRAAPFLGLGFLYLSFSALEYGRSWVTYYAGRFPGSFWEFSALRLTGYYATSTNNAFLFHAGFASPDRYPFFSFPFVSLAGGKAPAEEWQAYLHFYANPEFNNSGFILNPISELGLAVGVAYLVVLGLLIGVCWARFRSASGTIVDTVLYCSVAYCLLDIGRTNSFLAGRALPLWVGLLILARSARARK